MSGKKKALILAYHRVVDLKPDPQLLSVSLKNFDRQMQVMSERFNPLPINDLIRFKKEGKIPENSISVTFDDGYYDNFKYALPILKRHKIPATFFVATEHIGQDKCYWWDELEKIFLWPGLSFDSLEINVGQFRFQWENDSPNQRPEKTYLNWNLLTSGKRSPAQRLYINLHQAILPLKPDLRSRVMAKLRAIALNGKKFFPTNHRIMTEKELASLSADPLVEIGGHTHTHPVLSRLSRLEQYNEIIQNMEKLKLICNKPIKGFAFPFGGQRDYDKDSIQILTDLDFQYACSCSEGVVEGHSDFELPRYTVRDWNKDIFQDNLRAYLQRIERL